MQLLRRHLHLLVGAIVVLSAPAYFVAYQTNETRHFGFGRWDSPWIVDNAHFYPHARMEGPVRQPDGSVEVRDFVGRLTRKSISIRLPYHARGDDLELKVRCHRFGLEGTVFLSVNGRPIEKFDFTKRSYPWGGVRAVVPREVAERGPLLIEIRTEGGEAPPSHLPPDLGIGLDWIEVGPASGSILLLPTAREWIDWFLVLFAGALFFGYLPWTAGARAVALLLLTAALLAGTAFLPLVTSRALAFAWLTFPAGIGMLWLAERLEPSRA